MILKRLAPLLALLPPAAPARSAQPFPCEVAGPGEVCGVEVQIVPYITGGPFGGFQSDSGTGASSPIQVTFSEPVAAVVLIVLDPDFPGNRVVARDEDGAAIAITEILGDSTPNRLTADTVVLRGCGIHRLELVPAAGDYVAYAGLRFSRSPADAGRRCDTRVTLGR